MSTTIINIAAERLRKSNIDHKDNKKKWYEASSLANLLASYSNYTGSVPETYKPAFFQKVTGMSRNTFYARLRDAEELGFILWQRSDGNTPTRIKVIAPWLSYYVKHTPELLIDEPVEEGSDTPVPKFGTGPVPKSGTGPCTKIWYSNRLLELQEKTIVQAGHSLESEDPAITDSPTGKPVGAGKDLQKENTGNKNTESKEEVITDTGGYSYMGKYPHAWTADTREEYFWKEEVYEMVMKDNKARKALERGAAACDVCTANQFAHELLDGWYKNDIRIHPSLRGVEKLIEKHIEYMQGPWKGVAKAAPDTELYEIASKIVNYTKTAWPWFGKNPYGVELEDAEEAEADAIVRIMRAKRATPAQVRSLVALVTFSQDRSFGHFQDYAQDKIYDKELMAFIESGLRYAQEFATHSSDHKAEAEKLADILEGIGAYELKL
jgi:hypothetical protein